ncbi:MAG TPA: hypothetical protein VGN12_27660 [Pirellulales bacterium]|jgi:hypothetical protein
MRTFAYSIVVSCCIVSAAFANDDAAAVTEQASDRTVTIDGREFKPAFVEAVAGASLMEFVPTGETLENWTRLAAIREYAELDNPLEVVQEIVKKLDKCDPPANAEVMQNPKNGAVVLSFTVWSEDKSFAEYNVFEYCRRPEGGLVSYQYAIRAYGDEAEPFAKSLDADARAGFFVDAIEFASSQGNGGADALSDAGNGFQVQKFEPINARSSESTSDDPASDDSANSDSTSSSDASSNDDQRRDDQSN